MPSTVNMKLMRFTIYLSFLLFILPAPSIIALPVQKPFADFPKAILFTGATTPESSVKIIVANPSDNTVDSKSGLIMTPLGDGSWAVMATVYSGASYQYYFEFRIPEFEPDSTDAFLNTEPNGTRNQDSNRSRTITIPSNASNGYVVYNAYGDKSVWGEQGADTTFSIANPFLASWLATTLISQGTDHDTSGSLEGTNSYDVNALQIGTSKAQLSWDYSIGGDNFAPHVEGASRFLSGAPLYGFQILRAESNPITPLSQLPFQNITQTVTGFSIYSDEDDSNPWNSPIYLIDTSIVAQPDSVFVYTIKTVNAYGMSSYETKQFEWSGGYKEIKWIKPAVEIDGSIDAMYGSPIANDPRGDQSFSNLDLTRMWVTRDVQYLYYALEIAGDIFQANWGAYVLLIDTTGDSQGAVDLKHASLGSYAKNVAFPSRRPEYAVFIKTSDQTNGPPADVAELMKWDGSSWSSQGNALISRSTNNETSWIEVALTYSTPFGFVPRIWTEAFSTGNDYLNPARDVINKVYGDSGNNEWNVTGDNWNVPTTAKLSVSTPFPPALLPPVGLSVTAWDTRAIISWMPPAQNINLIDHYEIYLDSNLSKVDSGIASARVCTTATNVNVIETSGLISNTTYYARIFSVAVDGESIGSNIGQCQIKSPSDSIISTFTDALGVTEIEITKSSLNYNDTYYYLQILNYDEIYDYANFTETELAISLAAIDEANEKIFFDPTVELISNGIYPDTYSPIRLIRIIRPSGAIAPSDYFVEATLRIHYITTDSVTVYSPGFVNERRLVIRKLDENSKQWVAPSSEKTQWVQVDSDRVAIITSELSIWNVLAGAGDITNFDRLVVYPNPFNAKEYIDAGHPLPARITFAFMPPSTDRIEIFNVAGERVRILNREDASEFEVQGNSVIAKWDAKNDFSRDVASGVYIFWIRANGMVKIGKVAIIK